MTPLLRQLTAVLPAASLLLAGCTSLENSAPIAPLKADLQRKDFELIGSVKGHAKTTYIMAGLFQIVDGEFTLCGWQMFGDCGTMTIGGPADPLTASATTLPFLTNLDFTRTHARAMYRAYCQAPEADAVYSWTFLRNASGIPLIWNRVDVSARAYAIRIKPETPPNRPGRVPTHYETENPIKK